MFLNGLRPDNKWSPRGLPLCSYPERPHLMVQVEGLSLSDRFTFAMAPCNTRDQNASSCLRVLLPHLLCCLTHIPPESYRLCSSSCHTQLLWTQPSTACPQHDFKFSSSVSSFPKTRLAPVGLQSCAGYGILAFECRMCVLRAPKAIARLFDQR